MMTRTMRLRMTRRVSHEREKEGFDMHAHDEARA